MAPHRPVIVLICLTSVIGMIPGRMGTSMPTARASSTKLKYSSLSKKSWVMRKRRSGVDLLLEEAQIVGEVARLGMDLRKAGGADGERVARADQVDKLGGVVQTFGVGGPLGLSPRRVAPQREHVLDPRRGDSVEHRLHLADRGPDAGQVRHCLHAELLLDPLGQLHRALTRRAAGAVGDRHEVGRELAQIREGLAQVALALLALGREELEGEARTVSGLEEFIDAHGRGNLPTLTRTCQGYDASVQPSSPRRSTLPNCCRWVR